uniref:Tyrosine-protein phosphatase domain-containing protein n=1 Tax=Panagrolaimus davidi TaxID=227884 RepID=A0A914PWK0_9BILA
MALKANHNVIISTQQQFLNALHEKTPELIKSEWNGKLAKVEGYSPKAYDDEEAKAAKQPSEPRKTRYRSIECNDYERIKVDGVGYFHGNAIKDCDGKKLFIATQGPTELSMKDFWKVIIQERCKVIVMLCEVYEPAVEDGKEVRKERSNCYWPV